MSRALQLAEHGRYTTRPNPRVGCVICKDDQILAEGWHYRAGEPHAEIHALSQLDAQQKQGATVYVTLEPCSHQGKTGPCSEALINADVARVVYGMQDPNPLVSGRGLNQLKAAGITVDGPVLEEQAQALNAGFILRMQQQRPRVRCKLASSLDGATAMASGESQWITGAAARKDVQRLRAQSCAIITGIGSIEQDNSRLTLRADELILDNADDVIALPPLRVVLDTHLRIDNNAAIFTSPGKIIIATSEQTDTAKEQALLAQWPNVVIERLPLMDERINLQAVVERLAQDYECNELLVEAGARLSGAFLQAGLVDEFIIYQAPVLMGSQTKPLLDMPLATMAEKVSLTITDQRAVGHDWRITATPNRVL